MNTLASVISILAQGRDGANNFIGGWLILLIVALVVAFVIFLVIAQFFSSVADAL